MDVEDSKDELFHQFDDLRQMYGNSDFVSDAVRPEKASNNKPNNKDNDNTVVETVKSEGNEASHAAHSEHSDDNHETPSPTVEESEDDPPSQAGLSKTRRSKTLNASARRRRHNRSRDSSDESPPSDASSRKREPLVEDDEKLDEEQEVGSKAEVHDFYANEKYSKDGRVSYTDKMPINVSVKEKLESQKKTNSRNKTYAILHFHGVQGPFLKSDHIDIQSTALNEFLHPILKDYPDVDTEAPHVTFDAPYMPFLHRRTVLEHAEKAITDQKLKSHVSLLREVLTDAMADTLEKERDFQKTGYISYSDIMIPFIPGEVIVQSVSGDMHAGRLKEAYVINTEREKYCGLLVEVIDYDGSEYGYKEYTWRIELFSGMSPVTKLACYPLKSSPDHKSLEEKLLRRGRKFESLQGGRHIAHYVGTVQGESSGGFFGGSSATVTLSERIIVDAHAYYRFQDRYNYPLKPLKKDSHEPAETIKSSEVDEKSPTKREPLTDEEAILVVPHVRGFALDKKAWFKFKVDNVGPVVWNKGIIKSLVLADDEKELLLALVARQSTEEDEQQRFDDFALGKGRGMIMLLAGPPGVGKTLTAESVAEELQKPLYRVRAGDLGISAERVESALQKALDVCAYFDAVLLIDEADVFLEQRTTENLAQNELVAVFLVLLEYYQGILILTTNRTASLDPAFESRIDIALSYSDLDVASRRQIWRNFLDRFPDKSHDISQRDLDWLAEWKINGRQIKSAVKTARILALKQGVPMARNHLQTVLMIRKRGAAMLGSGGLEGMEPKGEQVRSRKKEMEPREDRTTMHYESRKREADSRGENVQWKGEGTESKEKEINIWINLAMLAVVPIVCYLVVELFQKVLPIILPEQK